MNHRDVFYQTLLSCSVSNQSVWLCLWREEGREMEGQPNINILVISYYGASDLIMIHFKTALIYLS